MVIVSRDKFETVTIYSYYKPNGQLPTLQDYEELVLFLWLVLDAL